MGVLEGCGAMAFSVDLRERVLAAHDRRAGSQRVLTKRFLVLPGTVNMWLRVARSGQRRRTTEPVAMPRPGAPIPRSCATSSPT